MIYRYRVQGVTDNAFILRGMYFREGCTIDTQITESELAFIKERCRLNMIEDITVRSEPIPTNSQITAKGVKNELPKSTIGANKGTSKAKV